MGIHIHLFGQDKPYTPQPNDHDTVESVIWFCLSKLPGSISPENVVLFGLCSRDGGHWLRPGLLLSELDSLDFSCSSLELRLRFRFPPYRATASGKLRRPVRFTREGGEKLFSGGVGEYLFHQTRSDLLTGKAEIAPEHSFGTAMGIAVVDTLRLRAEERSSNVFRDTSNSKPKMKSLLPPKSASDLAKHNWFNALRLNRSFQRSLKRVEKEKEFEGAAPEFFREQYLANAEPLLRKQDWGEVFTLGGDQGELWVHPETGLKLKRKGESEWRKLADFSEILAVTRRHNKAVVQFTTLSHMEVELQSEASCVDLCLLLEGLFGLLVAAHHHFDEKLAWPFLLEQSMVNGFGSIERATAEACLQPGQCLIRRSPEPGKWRSFYLTARDKDSKVTNYLIGHSSSGFAFEPGEAGTFVTLAELVADCESNGARFPFDIAKRITPYSVGSTRLQVIRASVADHIAFDVDQTSPHMPEPKFELPSHSMYAQSQITFSETLPNTAKLLGGFSFTVVIGATIKQSSNQAERKVVVKKLDYDPYKHQNISPESLRDSYHGSIEFVHQINHPYICRMIGIITQMGSVLIERAAIGSLDKYLQMKVIQINDNRLSDIDESLEDTNDNQQGNSASFETTSEATQSGNTVSFVLTDTYRGQSDSSSTIKTKPEKRKRNWQAWHLEVFWQIGTALNYLQQKRLTHGNLRASNILIFNDNPASSSPVIKLSDPGISTYSYTNGSTKHMALSPPWRPIEHLQSVKVENLSPPVDTWSFATTVAEICNWCQETLNRFGYPDEPAKFTQEHRKNYRNGAVVPLAEWIQETNPRLKELLVRCWSNEPKLRPSFRELLREINTAKVIARQNDNSLTVPVPSNPSVMDDHLNVDSFDDSMLQHVRRLGQGHFGIVELCTYEADPLLRPGFNELVAVKRNTFF